MTDITNYHSKITFRLPKKQKKRVAKLAKEMGWNESDIMRKALANFLAYRKRFK